MTDIEVIKELALVDIPDIKPLETWSDQIKDRASGRYQKRGDVLPWAKTENLLRLREGELVVWSGMSGHRKSLLLGQVMLHIASQGKQVAIASLEMPPSGTAYRMARQAVGCNPSDEWVDKFTSTVGKNIRIFDVLQLTNPERILGFLTNAAEHFGSRHVVIDSITKLGIGGEKRDDEIKFIQNLQDLTKRLKCTVHLVAHIRKPQGGDESYRPNKFDVRGSGQITDLADTVIGVWTNKLKEKSLRRQREGITLNDKQTQSLLQPCMSLDVFKQRDGDFEDSIALWFDQSSLQAVGADGARPKEYLEKTAENPLQP